MNVYTRCGGQGLYEKAFVKTQLKDQEDNFAKNIPESLKSCAQVHADASSNILEEKAAVDKKWEKLKKMRACRMTTVRNEVIQEVHRERRTVHFATLMDICHLKYAELEPQFQKYIKNTKAVCYPEVTLWRTIQAVTKYLFTGRLHRKWRPQKVMDHCQSTWMRRASSRRSISVHSSRHGRCTKSIENS